MVSQYILSTTQTPPGLCGIWPVCPSASSVPAFLGCQAALSIRVLFPEMGRFFLFFLEVFINAVPTAWSVLLPILCVSGCQFRSQCKYHLLREPFNETFLKLPILEPCFLYSTFLQVIVCLFACLHTQRVHSRCYFFFFFG